jgi:hypothetical protein
MFAPLLALLTRIPVLLMTYLTPAFIFAVVKVLGVTLITYTGVDQMFEYLSDYVNTSLNSIDSKIYQGMLMFGIVDGLKTLLSAVAAAWQINIARGAFKRISVLENEAT